MAALTHGMRFTTKLFITACSHAWTALPAKFELWNQPFHNPSKATAHMQLSFDDQERWNSCSNKMLVFE